MRAVIQRVNKSEVLINNEERKNIALGLLVLVGIEERDTSEDISWLAKKIVQLRIFNDEKGIMNQSVVDVQGEIMIISQFTLHAQTKKGNRPSYIKAAKPQTAIPVYESFISEVRKYVANRIVSGEFGAHMVITLENDGPVTILMDTKNKE